MNDKPFNRINLFNNALPAANSNLLSGTTTPATASFQPQNADPSLLRIYVCMSIAGILSVTRTVGATTVNETLNSGNALIAGAAYMFSIAAKAGEAINLQYSTTSGTIYKLQIDESWS